MHNFHVAICAPLLGGCCWDEGSVEPVVDTDCVDTLTTLSVATNTAVLNIKELARQRWADLATSDRHTFQNEKAGSNNWNHNITKCFAKLQPNIYAAATSALENAPPPPQRCTIKN